MSDLVSLNGQQRNDLQDLVDNPHLAPAFALRSENNPNLRVFLANFDGTWNDKDKVPLGGSMTLVGLTHENAQKHESASFVTHYSHGVGTRTSKTRSFVEGANGSGCEERAESMHSQLAAQVMDRKGETPEAVVHVCATGFSRGAATAVHFLNLVHDRGAIAPDAGFSLHQELVKMGVGPRDVKSSALLLDIVATGQENVLKLTLPASTQASLHLIAGGEERRHFKVTQLTDERFDRLGKPIHSLGNLEWAQAKNVPIPPLPSGMPAYPSTKDGTFFYHRLKESPLPGARHSDVGGTYTEGGMGRIPQYLSDCFLRSLGIPGEKPVKPQMETVQRVVAHDSRDGIELAMQRAEALMGTQHSREQVDRLRAERVERTWSGDVLRTVTISLLDKDKKEVAKRVSRMVVPHEEDTPIRTAKSLGAARWVAIDPLFVQKRTTIGLGGGARLGSTGGFKIDNETQTVHFQGMRIDDVEEENSLSKTIFDKTPDRRLEIHVDDEKLFCVLQDGKQNVPSGHVMNFEFGQEQWPSSVRFAVSLLNKHTDLDPSNDGRPLSPMSLKIGSYLVGDAMKEVADILLREFPLLDEISLNVVAKNTPFNEQAPITVAASVISDGVTLTYPTNVPSKDVDELALRQLLGNMVRGIEEVAQMMQSQGFSPVGMALRQERETSKKILQPS